jgi:hypothetical protein
MRQIGILFSVVAVFLISSQQAQTRTGYADAQQPSAARSRLPKVTIANSELRTIKSTSTGRDYDLYIHIPKQYDKDQTAKYPVLYVLDGQWEFKLVDQVVGCLVFDPYMPDVIIVGITVIRPQTSRIALPFWTLQEDRPRVSRARVCDQPLALCGILFARSTWHCAAWLNGLRAAPRVRSPPRRVAQVSSLL